MKTVAPRKTATFDEETRKDGFAENQERLMPIHKSLEQRIILIVVNPTGGEQISCQGTGMVMDIEIYAKFWTQLRQSTERHVKRLPRGHC